ncbi:MAG: hypothetical protein ABW215_19830 [Kibdelosporangium sp.]
MGFFGTYLYDGKAWTTREPSQAVGSAEPWLLIDIHDSDITTVTYHPAGTGSGTAYLGSTPRTYFEEEQASAPTDVHREAGGLVAWVQGVHGTKVELEQVVSFLAEDEDPADLEWDEEEDVDELDDAEIFVEVKTARFLAVLNLPVPDGISDRER